MSLPIIMAAIRGVLKGFPIVNAITEAIKNKKVKQSIENVTSEIGAVEDSIVVPEIPHSYVSIAFQLITAIVILYAFFTKQMTAESVIDTIRSIFNF